MPIEVHPICCPDKNVKITSEDHRKRRARAYQFGVYETPCNPMYTFELDEWNRGKEQTQRIRQELAKGER